jgi:hypothetical protein
MSKHKRQKGLYVLWHDDSPGTRVTIVPGLLRRLGIRRSPFATYGEYKKSQRLKYVEKDFTRLRDLGATAYWASPLIARRDTIVSQHSTELWNEAKAREDAKERSERFP